MYQYTSLTLTMHKVWTSSDALMCEDTAHHMGARDQHVSPAPHTTSRHVHLLPDTPCPTPTRPYPYFSRLIYDCHRFTVDVCEVAAQKDYPQPAH